MISLNNTFLPNKIYENRNWFIIDCSNQKVGRLATIVASLLEGKIKPHYYPSIDIGDYVILINANSIIINSDSKHYLVYKPGHPGHSLKIRKASDSTPRLTLEHAIKGMLSKSKTKRLMNRLKIYNDQNHLHDAQQPLELDCNNLEFGKLKFNEYQ